jgi:lipopolysaccharide biosynthesis glycosyltransferase
VCGDVSSDARALIEKTATVVTAPLLRSSNFENLKLLGRTELDVTYSKLHVFNPELFPYERVCFLDADVLVLQNMDSIFTFIDDVETVFAAAPDVGWPDCFNSGVFVTKPDALLFDGLLVHSAASASFDGDFVDVGGDQGLLNSFFSDWSLSASKRTARLPFTFNVTPSAYYSYLPALKQFKHDIKAVHFIGSMKPWKWSRFENGSIIPMYYY